MIAPRKIMMFLAQALLVYLCLLAGLYLAQRKMMYAPTHGKPQVSETGLSNLQEITVTTSDGLHITGWYLPPASASRSTIVFFHGNGNNTLYSMMKMPAFIKQGYGILIAEYRGYSGNPGSPSEEGLYNDARAYIDWLNLNGTDQTNIILYAESLGTGIATKMAEEYNPFQAIVLEAPFSSALEVASDLYWFVPVKYLMHDRYDNLARIAKIKSPLIVVHGTKDTIVPLKYSQKLFEKAPYPKTFITIEDAGHNDLSQRGAADKILGVVSE